MSHFYRQPSWMYTVNRLGRQNIEYKEEDPPVNEFYTDEEVLDFFQGYKMIEAVHEHERLLRARRDGWKAFLYHNILMPMYNLLQIGRASCRERVSSLDVYINVKNRTKQVR